jgi:RNA polymerase sigma-70 factor (ECF subfamily)
VTDETDEALAGRAGQGCRASFTALLDRHYDRIYRLAWRWSGSRSSAEDIAQDVCIKLASALKSYRAESAFKTWLHRVTYTTTLDFLRLSQRMIAVEPSEIITLVDRSVESAADDAVDGAELWTAVRALPNQQRDAVLLVYGEDMNHAEAASIMGCSEKTVSWHLHEAKKRLRIRLEAVG